MNYFNYFTEIEEHFQAKRGAQILLSPVDWALIASWREAGIPLETVLAGIDQSFEKFDSGKRRDTQRHRSLVYCAAAVLEAEEARRAAAVGAAPAEAPPRAEEDAFHHGRVSAHFQAARERLAGCPALASQPARDEVLATLDRLLEAAAEPGASLGSLEELERVLTVCDEKLLQALTTAATVEEMVELRAESERELAPYRRRLRPEQAVMIERQFLQRKLLERAGLRRLSLFYMG